LTGERTFALNRFENGMNFERAVIKEKWLLGGLDIHGLPPIIGTPIIRQTPLTSMGNLEPSS
jgi:hypothetical protein